MAKEISRIIGDCYCTGAFSASELAIPAGTVNDEDVAADAAIDANKLVGRQILCYAQTPGTAIVADTRLLFVARAAGVLVELQAAVDTLATGNDRIVSIDLKKSTGGGSWTTVLSGVLTFDDGDTARTAKAGTITTAAFVAGDLLELVVTVAGSNLAQAQGLIVTVHLDEDPN